MKRVRFFQEWMGDIVRIPRKGAEFLVGDGGGPAFVTREDDFDPEGTDQSLFLSVTDRNWFCEPEPVPTKAFAVMRGDDSESILFESDDHMEALAWAVDNCPLLPSGLVG